MTSIKTYNVFLAVRVTTRSQSKTKAILEASNKFDKEGTIVGAEVSVLRDNKWKHLEPVWYD